MTPESIYELLWQIFEPVTRKMDAENMAEFDGYADEASRKIAAKIAPPRRGGGSWWKCA